GLGRKGPGLFAKCHELRLLPGPVQRLLHRPEAPVESVGLAKWDAPPQHRGGLTPLPLQATDLQEPSVGLPNVLPGKALRGLQYLAEQRLRPRQISTAPVIGEEVRQCHPRSRSPIGQSVLVRDLDTVFEMLHTKPEGARRSVNSSRLVCPAKGPCHFMVC